MFLRWELLGDCVGTALVLVWAQEAAFVPAFVAWETALGHFGTQEAVLRSALGAQEAV